MVVEADGLPQFAPPYKLSDFDFAIERSAPAPGQHSDEILREAGYRRRMPSIICADKA